MVPTAHNSPDFAPPRTASLDSLDLGRRHIGQPFDAWKLRCEIRRAGLPEQNLPVHCSLKLARAVWPGLKSYRLSALAEHLQIRAGQAHSASGDTETLVGVVDAIRRERPWLRWSRVSPGGWI